MATRFTPTDALKSDVLLKPQEAFQKDAFSRVGTERLVMMDGVTGLFTPLTETKDGQLTEDERANLLTVIDQLKTGLAESESEAIALRQQIDVLRNPPSSASDFASGVQQSLDELTQRLSEMHNPVSNFAVREFTLEASVCVQVSALGSIEYRFVQAGDEVNASALSKLALTVVPLPKADLTGVFTPNLFQPGVSVAALPGISTKSVQQLETTGTYTLGEFLQTSTRLRAQVYLEALLGTSRTQLALWAQQALLMTLRGVDGRVALVLIEAALGSFDALAVAMPEDVSQRYHEARKSRPDLEAPEVPAEWPALWVAAARQYLGLSAEP